MGMTERPKSDPNAELHRTLNNACRMGCSGNPLTISAEAVAQSLDRRSIDHHRVIEKIRADIPAGELTLLRGEAARLGVPPKQDMESFSDQPIARGVGDTATDAIKTMWPLQWRAPKNG